MSRVQCILVWLCVCLAAVGADNAEFLNKRISVAMCRASCLDKFGAKKGPRTSPRGCTTDPKWKCAMCWDYCDMLNNFHTSTDQMCSDDICFDGCKHACKFYTKKSTGNVYLSEKISKPNVNGNFVFWNTHPKSKQHVVYVGFNSVKMEHWQEIDQTVNKKLLIASSTVPEDITIFAVTSNHIVGFNSTINNFSMKSDKHENNVTKEILANCNNVFACYLSEIKLEWVLCIVIPCILLVAILIFYKFIKNVSPVSKTDLEEQQTEDCKIVD